jgi:hypothetical protein
MSRWKPDPEKQNESYRRIDEGIAKFGVTFTTPMTLEQRIEAAERAGANQQQQARRHFAAEEVVDRAFLYTDGRESMAFLRGYLGEHDDA